MAEATTESEAWISLSQARLTLRCGPATISRLIKSGKLEVLKVPFARIRVSQASVSALYESSKPLKP